jgi:YD repeat-containing protein
MATSVLSGEVAKITRHRGSLSQATPGQDVVRWMRYDSLGRMLLNVEPNTTVGFSPDPSTPAEAMKAWRYAYDDAGDLVGTSDARGCGANYHYDAAGRLIAEDYSPCLPHHAPYSAPNLATGEGTEVSTKYDNASCGLDPKPSRHQVTNLPPLRAEVTEYQRHRLRCGCGHVTEVDWPRDMPRGAFGPGLTALVGYLGGVCHLSHDQTQKLCADVLGITMARGSVVNYRGHVACSLREPQAETVRAVRQAPHLHADEMAQCPHGRGVLGVGGRLRSGNQL